MGVQVQASPSASLPCLSFCDERGGWGQGAEQRWMWLVTAVEEKTGRRHGGAQSTRRCGDFFKEITVPEEERKESLVGIAPANRSVCPDGHAGQSIRLLFVSLTYLQFPTRKQGLLRRHRIMSDCVRPGYDVQKMFKRQIRNVY